MMNDMALMTLQFYILRAIKMQLVSLAINHVFPELIEKKIEF